MAASKTTNLYHALSRVMAEHGHDMEDETRDLFDAFCANCLEADRDPMDEFKRFTDEAAAANAPLGEATLGKTTLA